ncbi:MAG: PcfJ domain-containing protein [Lachnospiraceae bacterium]|nr:PcfJ domain-containing protein [Lachnospiraceae bacterium]MCM1239383.1 PcfJ domain-containing protein [Lachnospiraceae bacterium]
MKSRGRRGYLCDSETCQVVQKTGPDEAVIRIIKCRYVYKTDDTSEKQVYENARFFVKRKETGGIQLDSYYNSYGSGLLTPWRRGLRPVFSQWQYSFEADICGHVYCGNLPGALEGTPWQYCPIGQFYGHIRENMEMRPFLSAYLDHPKLEHMVKTGFYMLAADLVYHGDYSHILDESQDRTHRLLRVMAEDIPFLRHLDPDMSTLKIFQGYCRMNLKDRQKLLLWQISNKVGRDIMEILVHMMPHKMMRYLDSQYSFLSLRRNQYGSLRYPSMQELVSEYRDYLDMCVKQGYDMRNSFVLYPKDLQKSHDKAAHRIKMKADAKMRRDFKAAYKSIMQRMDFEMDGMKILYPATPDEIIAEGHALHHCVGGYVERVARKECIILFLRRCGEESKPFYTIEVKGREVTQVRGMKNDPPTPKVESFMEQWEKEVLAAPVARAAA